MSETDSSGGTVVDPGGTSVDPTGDTSSPTALPSPGDGSVGGPEIPGPEAHPVPHIEPAPAGGFPEVPQEVIAAGIAAGITVGVAAAAGAAVVAAPVIAAGAAAAGAAAFIIHTMEPDPRILAADGPPEGTEGPQDLDGDGLFDT